MVTVEALQTLDAIDRKGSFAAAAEELYRVPSAITYTIKKLEEQLDVRLFDRDKQRAVLTPAGRLVLEKGREILNSVQQLETQAKQAASGWETQLRIVVDTILPCEPLWPMIVELQQQHPWLDIRIMEESLSGSWEALIQDRADLIIGVSGDEPPGGHWLKHPIANLRSALCCSPHHPAAQLSQPVDQEQLQQYTHIVISDSGHLMAPRTVGMLGLDRFLRVSTITQKVSALIHGAGISHLPLHYLQEYLDSGQLVQLREASSHTGAIFMCWRRSNTGKANAWLRQEVIDKEPWKFK